MTGAARFLCALTARAVTCTTRPARPGEKDGVHYYFLDAGTFLKRVQAGNFLEHATVFAFNGDEAVGVLGLRCKAAQESKQAKEQAALHYGRRGKQMSTTVQVHYPPRRKRDANTCWQENVSFAIAVEFQKPTT